MVQVFAVPPQKKAQKSNFLGMSVMQAIPYFLYQD